jgi:hypothetical protein
VDDELVSVQCPCCGAWQALVLDPDSSGEMVQDCEICCEPWQMSVFRSRSGAVTIRLERMN